MKHLLFVKHWLVFILLLIGLWFQTLTVEDNELQTAILSVAGVVLYFLWPISMGFQLRKYLPPNVRINFSLYIVNMVAWLTIYSLTIMVFGGFDFNFEGINIIPLIYLLYAFVHFLMFPAKLIKSIEKGGKAWIYEYFGYFLLILFLPVGIWYLQPRVNNIVRTRMPKKQ
jgi:hypothetical protein